MLRAVWSKAIWLASCLSIICQTSLMGDAKIIEILTPEKTVSKRSTDWLAQEHTYVLKSIALDMCNFAEDMVYVAAAVQNSSFFDTTQDAYKAAKSNEAIKQIANSVRYKCRKSKIEDCIIARALNNTDGVYALTHCMNKEVFPIYIEVLCINRGATNEFCNRIPKWTEKDMIEALKYAKLSGVKISCWEMNWYNLRRSWRDTQRICR